ncbi:hypothetical protein JTE90_002202 [Oedothorax gibbosus]|uniref:Uncharacterized protein n=1 Tax=Oedothorax gibbosus TaxID=931172 RepID=A0AAV6VIZ1_9ARAC|nr:hypothetical protein JTE90_002202 [Oedothorax gibbosus]
MATLTQASLMVSNVTDDVIATTPPNPPPSLFSPPLFPRTNPSTLSPGHAAILEMHANSQSNAILYVAMSLQPLPAFTCGLPVAVVWPLRVGMGLVVIKYIRTERYEARLSRLFQNLVQRDRFFRLSRRRSSLPKCPEDIVPPTDLPLSPTGLQVPEITTSTVHTPSDPSVQEGEQSLSPAVSPLSPTSCCPHNFSDAHQN